MKAILFSLLFCALLALVAARGGKTSSSSSNSATSTITLNLNDRSTSTYVAVEIENAGVQTSAVQIKDAKAKSWSSMTYSTKGYWYQGFSSRVTFPLSFQLTSVNGETIVLSNVIKSLQVSVVDTGKQYGSSSSSVTSSPTTAPTSKATSKATTAPTTKKPSSGSSSGSSSTTSTTKAAAATTKPSATTKPAATTKPSSSSSSSSGSAGMKMMVPLYTYPGSTWDTVIASAKTIATVAIINPNSGPGSGPDSAFTTYTQKMANAGVEMIGYVHTSYGARSISDVKKEIDVYASEFSHVTGIFLDEAAATSDKLSYYQELHTYIMSLPGFKYNVINPGAVTTSGYTSAATQIVTFESSSSSFSSSSNPSFASASNKDQFVAISYGASSASSMQSFLDTAKSKGYYGWAFVNSGSLSGGTYNSLPSYYAQEATYMASLN